MKFLVFFTLLAVAAAAESQAEEQSREKRGVLGLGGYPGLGYSGYGGYGYGGLGYPSLGLGYGAIAAPLPVAKVIAPAAYHAPILPAYHAPITKVIQPYPAIAKVGYASPLLSSPYGLGHGYGAGYGYGLGHGYGAGYGLGYGYGGLLH